MGIGSIFPILICCWHFEAEIFWCALIFLALVEVKKEFETLLWWMDSLETWKKCWWEKEKKEEKNALPPHWHLICCKCSAIYCRLSFEIKALILIKLWRSFLVMVCQDIENKREKNLAHALELWFLAKSWFLELEIFQNSKKRAGSCRSWGLEVRMMSNLLMLKVVKKRKEKNRIEWK